MSKRISLGVVGLGIGGVVAKTIAAQIASGRPLNLSICDMDQVKVDKLMAELREGGADCGSVCTFNSFTAMLNGVDAVYIATPNHTHRDLAVQAAQAGKHVWLEKPMAPTLADAEAIAAAVREEGVAFMLQLNNNRPAWFRQLVSWLRGGRLGDLVHLNLSWKRRKGAPFPGLWFSDKSKSGGGALVDLGPHLLGLLYELLVAPHSKLPTVQATVNCLADGQSILGPYGGGLTGSGPVDVEMAARVRLTFVIDGRLVTVDVETAWACHNVQNEEFIVELVGTAGSAKQHRVWPENNGSDADATESLVLRTQSGGVPVEEVWNSIGDPASRDPLMGRDKTLDVFMKLVGSGSYNSMRDDAEIGAVVCVEPALWIQEVIHRAYVSAESGLAIVP